MIYESAQIKTISDVAKVMSTNNRWLSQQNNADEIVTNIRIDGEIQGLDVAIYLLRERHYFLAEKLLVRMRESYPNGSLTYYQSALAAAGMLDYEKTITYASRAISLSPTSFEYRSLLARACVIGGMPNKARFVLRNTLPRHQGEVREFAKLAQFIDLCDNYPIFEIRKSLHDLENSGAYLQPFGCSEFILSAIDSGPFSMVRLGDGEGAWLRFDAYDEGRFSSLYSENRSEFLNDWFGNANLITDDAFLKFSKSLQNTFKSHDLIGITPADRLDLEVGFLSIRGISTAINTFRFLDLCIGKGSNIPLCSNSVNLALASSTDFYPSLLRKNVRFGIVTSQPTLAGRMREHGIDVLHEYIVPGDSRNFHLDRSGIPECQYPSHVEKIDADLSARDLRGVVFLVAAGYVGKRYLSTIRARGGIAIDLGSLADHWVRHGLPL